MPRCRDPPPPGTDEPSPWPCARRPARFPSAQCPRAGWRGRGRGALGCSWAAPARGHTHGLGHGAPGPLGALRSAGRPLCCRERARCASFLRRRRCCCPAGVSCEASSRAAPTPPGAVGPSRSCRAHRSRRRGPAVQPASLWSPQWACAWLEVRARRSLAGAARPPEPLAGSHPLPPLGAHGRVWAVSGPSLFRSSVPSTQHHAVVWFCLLKLFS